MKFKPVLLALTLVLASCASLSNTNAQTGLQASGMIQATEIAVAPELSGRIVDITAAEGDTVKAGDVLFNLDDTLLKAQHEAAASALVSAQKGVDVAQAALDSAQVQYDTTLSDALAAAGQSRTDTWSASKPSDFNLPTWYFTEDERYQSTQTAVDAARSALDTAQANVGSVEQRVGSAQFLDAEKRLADARISFQLAQTLVDETGGASDSQRLHDAAQKILDDAKTELDQAQQAYDEAVTTQGAQDVLDARARAGVAQERLDLANDALRALQVGARSPEVLAASKAVDGAQAALDQAQAAADQAQAALALIDSQMDKLSITAPQSGVILTRSIQPGEVVQAGATALTIGDLGHLKVTVYIPEDQYGQIKLGEQATLSVDSFPGRDFTAKVSRIADQAEYTPQNVQTKEGRQTTVYAVELAVDNSDGSLKPGMPVDVTFAAGG
jgi:HlyD family secretion protein